ncbi:MAG: YigZ family protein [Firmicutes bacterium]|nr:YigZ family protein [Bacillota bacterium]
MGDSYITLDNICESKITISKSVFIANGLEVKTHQDVLDFLGNIRRRYPDANHHCWAYIIGDNILADDDGEPSGTAGLPILNMLKSNELNNLIIVVSRYFGGKKLGVRGLINAYRLSAKSLIDNAKFLERKRGIEFKFSCDYNFANKINTSKNKMIKVISQKFSEKVLMTVFVESTAVKDYIKEFENCNINIISQRESIN